MTEPQKQNWPQIIADIKAAGITHYKLSTMMRRQYNQITQWEEGHRVEHYDGEMLLAIHAEYVPRGTLS